MTPIAAVLAALLAAPGGQALDGAARARIARVAPAVVTLTSDSSVAALLEDLRREIGEQVEVHLPPGLAELRRRRVASGIAIDGEGHVVTTASFAALGDPMQATLSDGRKATAALVALDLPSDLALLKLEGAAPPAAPFAASPGALLAGAPLGVLGARRSAGCPIAAAHLIRARIHPGAGRLHDFLELSSDFDPGTAGAAVVNAAGEVVGLVSAVTRGGGTLATPSTTILQVTSELLKSGKIVRGWLGLTVASGASLAVPKSGIRVMGVVSGSPAETAGIRPGDVILSYGGKPVRDMGDFVQRVAEGRPDARVVIGGVREGGDFTVEAMLVARPESHEIRGIAVRLSEVAPYLGVSAEPLDEGERASSATRTLGVRIREIEARSPAASAGLAVGDVIVAVAGSPILSPEALDKAVAGLAPGQSVEIDLVRQRKPLKLPVTIEKRTTETTLSDLPQFHLAFDPAEWAAVRDVMRRLPGAEREQSVLELGRVLAGHGRSLSRDTRRQVEALKRELELVRPAPFAPLPGK
jgi:S1-C subfamily serine protease